MRIIMELMCVYIYIFLPSFIHLNLSVSPCHYNSRENSAGVWSLFIINR